MTPTPHDEFESIAAAYALDTLATGERRAFEAHLASCARCQSDVAQYRRVTVGLGLALTEGNTAGAAALPASLKARTMARATGRTINDRQARPSPSWLAAAAGILLAVATGIYAWSLHTQMDALQQLASTSSAQAQSLRAELAAARGDSRRLARTVEVLTAPDLMRVTLAGTTAASAASGRAFVSQSRGLLFSMDGLPALRTGRIYQLWFVLPNQAPISAGLLGVGANGSATMVGQLPAGFAVPKATKITVAITEEPAAGSAGPTTPILIAGSISTD